MRHFLASCAALWLIGPQVPARAEDIAAVLERSQQMQLQALTAQAPQPENVDIIQRSFDRLTHALPLTPAAELHVIRGDVVAETLSGHVVVANESLATLPEGQRLFVLAHELGHVTLGHWAKMGALYKRFVPGEVVQQQTDAVAHELGREASGLAHRQEFEADAFGFSVVSGMGYSLQTVQALFMQAGMQRDTVTHPGSWKRLAHLREVEAGVTDADDATAEAPPTLPAEGAVAALH